MNSLPKLYTIKQVTEILGVSTNTLYKYLSEGKINALRFSKKGRFRIPETEVTRLLGAKEEDKQHTPFLNIFKKNFSHQ